MTSHFASQYNRLRSCHSKIKSVKTDIHSLIGSCSEIDSISDFNSTKGVLRKALTELDEHIQSYSDSMVKLRRQVEKMISDNEDRKEAKEKEEGFFHAMRDGDDDGLSYDESYLIEVLLPSMESRVERTLNRAMADVNRNKTESIQAPAVPVHTDHSTNVSIDSSMQSGLNQSDLAQVLSRIADQSNLAPLPPITLSPFNGVSTLWESFISQFTSIIDSNPHLSDDAKLCYLRDALSGDALETVEGIPLGGKYLRPTIDRLKTAYGRSKHSNAILISQLNSIKPKSSSFEDQLSCTKKLINKVIQLDDSSIVDHFTLIHQIAGSIHSKHVEKMYKLEPSTMMEALTHIESDLRERIEIRNLQSTFRSTNRSDNQSNQRQKISNPVQEKTSSNSFIPKTPSNGPLCVYCGKHSLSFCTSITSVSERKKILKEKKLCYKCLSSQHMFSECDRTCKKCSKLHHQTICDSTSKVNQTSITAALTSHEPFNGVARLCTASAYLQNPMTSREANRHVFLDTGCMTSVISRSLVEELNLKPHGTQSMTLTGVGGEVAGGNVYDVVTVNLVTTKGLHSIQALVMDSIITRPMYLEPLSSDDYAIVRLHCGDASQFTHSSTVSPDLLISIDHVQKILADSTMTTLPSGYQLIQSIIGPMITGKTTSSDQSIHDHSILSSLIIDAPFDKQIEVFLSIDEAAREYGTTEAEARHEENQKVDNHFYDTVQRIGDNKYQVQYYLKPQVTELPSNRELAYSRLKSSHHSLSKNSDHIKFYDSIFKDQLASGMIEQVDPITPTDNQIHYLAHQAVLRPDKPTTPLRIVFDASAKLKGKPSLNDVIAPGPCTLEHIPSVLNRCRSRESLIIADVEKAFLQVHVHPSQRDLLRFFWIKDITKPVSNDNLIIYRFTVTPFGINQSPYILSKVIETHLKSVSNDENGHLTKQIADNVYVDNVVMNSDFPTPEMYTMPKSIFEGMGMNLRDFASNSIQFIQSVSESDRAPSGDQKLLGIIWNPTKDEISIRIPSLVKHLIETKRSMLSTIACIYDPLGIIQPLILLAKVHVQQLWCLNLKWDQAVDPSIQSRFHELISDIESFHLSLKRYTGMSSSNEIHLVAFADASKLAMGAMVYLWTPDQISLLMSKTRLAPAKSKATIPKLELNALVMAHTLLRYVVDSIRKEFPNTPIHTYVYSDSAITLFWNLNDPDKKSNGIFVTNRVKSIREISTTLSSIHNVHYHPAKYVRTDSNPADHITRGLSAAEMNNPNHMWWTGAPWMKGPPETWPDDPIPPTADPPYVRIVESTPTPLIDLDRYSTLKKAVNVTGFVLRFIRRSLMNSSNSSLKEKFHYSVMSTPSLTSIERIRALETLIRNHQSCHIQVHDTWIKNGIISKDETDIWRANSRLQNASIPSNAKSPILIPTSADSTLARLIISDTHEAMFHAGTENVLNQVKQRYWIPRSRQLVKSQVRSCIPCRKTNNLPYSYTETPPFPPDRVSMSKPFQSTGIDFIGPFSSKENSKMYGVIFTCLSSRLSHIEVTDSMFPSAFINAFRRFTSRRGTPTTVLSDQGTTLKLSSTLLHGFESEQALNTIFQQQSVQWKFTTSHAPWKGAVYERLIRIFKDCLSKSIGKRKLTLDEFSTIAAEIEAVLNSRPLTYVSSDDVKSFANPVLRPIDLILPGSHLAMQIHPVDNDDNDYVPRSEENMSRATAIRQLSRTIQVIDAFWSKWQTEYLTTIRDSKKDPDPLHCYRSSSIHPKPGAIVLVIDESGNTPRSTWHMARIISVSGSQATLKSHAGRTIQRPINLLIPLELDSIDEPTQSDPVANVPINHKMVTRSKSSALRQAGGNLPTSMSIL